MLRDEVALYSQLTGRDGLNVPVGIIGAYLDGYEKGKASAQPKRGKWIHHPEIGWGETWLCDQCGEKTASTVMGKPRWKFCPMCGAKMEGVDDE